MTGLSSLNFMEGAMKGYAFAEGISNNRKAQQRADKKFAMQKESLELDIESKKQQKMLADLQVDLRRMYETGEGPTEDFSKKYASIGIGNLMSKDSRDELMQAGTLLHRAVSENTWDDKSLDGINLALKDDLEARTKKDGLKRRIIGAKEVPTGQDADGDGVEDTRMVPILEVTRTDGSRYTAPLTKQGSTGPDDDLFTLNDKKLDEWYEAALQRANMAYLAEKSSDDPRAFANTLNRIYFGQDVYPGKKGDYEFKQIWDDETGTKRVAALNKENGKFSHWLGGSEDASKSGKGGSNKTEDEMLWEQVKNYQDAKAKAIENGDPDAVEQIDAMFKETTGVDFTLVEKAQQALLNRGENRRPTLSDIRALQAGELWADQEFAVDQAIAQNPEIFSFPSLKTAAGESQDAPEPPRQSEMLDESNAVIDIAFNELQSINELYSDPNTPGATRRSLRGKMQSILSQLNDYEREKVIALGQAHRRQSQERKSLAEVASRDEKARLELEQKISVLKSKLSDPSQYTSDLSRAVDARKLAEMQAKRQGTSSQQLANF